MLDGDHRRRTKEPTGAAYGDHAGLWRLFLVEVPGDAHRGVSERRGVNTPRLDARGCRDQDKNRKEPPELYAKMLTQRAASSARPGAAFAKKFPHSPTLPAVARSRLPRSVTGEQCQQMIARFASIALSGRSEIEGLLHSLSARAMALAGWAAA